MQTTMTPELYWLAAVALFTGLCWIPYIINRIVEMGLWPALRNPEPDSNPNAQWAYRAERAHSNAVESLVVFAPLAIGIHVTGASSALTSAAAFVFFAARVAHYVIYVAGIPLLRTITFTIGAVAYTILGLVLLGFLSPS